MKNKQVLINQLAESFFTLRQKCATKDLYLIENLKISLSEYNCLVQFFNMDTVGIKHLAKQLDLSPGGITRIVTILEEKKLVERKISPGDRRSIDVFLTESGKKLVAKMKKLSIDLHAEILGHIELQYREQVVMSVEMLIQAIDLWIAGHQELLEN
ncbi:hypothetical protein DRI50_09655 [candidate division KSB1 bacterium]|nr:MAG: hypothetical protein DRI50_09655 [candidate division KSB1 bacterium]